MMRFIQMQDFLCWTIVWLGIAQAAMAQAAMAQVNPNPHDPSTIWGYVMELRSGTPEVAVCLCDAATGIPVSKKTYKSLTMDRRQGLNVANEMAIVLTDPKGTFRFDNVPDGKYRLLAQKWMGEYKGPFENHGTVIQLMGDVDNVEVPRPNEYYQALVALSPPGEGIVQFDQDVGNSDTMMFLSTEPPEFDPILGLSAMGESFVKNLIGFNRMPLGKTTVIGVPAKPIFAFFMAPDNSPGFATLKVPVAESGFIRVPAEPFVAGWSDGRKIPPPKIAKLMAFMKEHSLTHQQVLKIPELSNATHKAYTARTKELLAKLSESVELAEGKSARIGDIMAAENYRRLAK